MTTELMIPIIKFAAAFGWFSWVIYFVSFCLTIGHWENEIYRDGLIAASAIAVLSAVACWYVGAFA